MNRDLMMLESVSPLGSLEAYCQFVSRIPLLTEPEEQALALRFRDQQDLEAARQLVLSHLRFVVHVARGYAGYGLALGDLIQEGNIGLMKAIKRFNPEMGVRLVSFAVHWIKAEMHEFILRNWRIVKIATTKAQRKVFFNLRKMKKRLGWFNREEVNAVAKELGVSAETIYQMEQRMDAFHDIRFEQDEDDDDSVKAPAQYLEDQRYDPAIILENDHDSDKNQTQLSTALAQLDARSLDIVKTRWLDSKKATLHELADKYQISAERVRQLENNALLKLRKFMPQVS